MELKGYIRCNRGIAIPDLISYVLRGASTVGFLNICLAFVAQQEILK